MIENYKHLNELSNAIKQFKLRMIKETTNYYSSFAIKYINEIELSDGVISDIIKLIQKEGQLTLKELISEVNKTITEKNYWLENEHKTKRIKNKKELICYMKKASSNYRIINWTIDSILTWDVTKKGFNFYSNLNKKISQILNNTV